MKFQDLFRIRDDAEPGNFHVLLGFLLLSIVLWSFASESALVFAFTLGGTLVVLLAAVRLVANTNATRWTGIGLILLWITVAAPLTVWDYVSEGGAPDALKRAVDTLEAVVLGWLMVQLVLALMHMRRVTSREVSASMCGYLLMGFWFHRLYTLMPPDYFDPHFVRGGGDETGANGFYFSFVTLSSLGYGDIRPVEPLARAVAIVEVVCGQFYLAVVIAKNVGLYLSQSRDDG